MGGTNDPELVRSMMDIISWIEKVQKWDLNPKWGPTGPASYLVAPALSR
jgi:hypothetical protein